MVWGSAKRSGGATLAADTATTHDSNVARHQLFSFTCYALLFATSLCSQEFVQQHRIKLCSHWRCRRPASGMSFAIMAGSARSATSRALFRPLVRPIRCASFATSSSSRAPSSSSAADVPPSSATTAGALPLTWPEYLSLRRQRRLWSTLTTVPTTFAGLTFGGGYFASLEADPAQLIMGIEPM